MISFISSLSKAKCGNQILWKQSRLENDPIKITPHWLLYIQFYMIVKMPGPCVGVCNYLVDIHDYCNYQLPSMDGLRTWIATATMVAMVAVDIQLPFLWELIFLLGLVVAKPINQLYGCSKQSWNNEMFICPPPFFFTEWYSEVEKVERSKLDQTFKVDFKLPPSACHSQILWVS